MTYTCTHCGQSVAPLNYHEGAEDCAMTALLHESAPAPSPALAPCGFCGLPVTGQFGYHGSRADCIAAWQAECERQVEEEREGCAVAVCKACAAGNKPFAVEGVLVHAFFRGGKECRDRCAAEAIRARGQS